MVTRKSTRDYSKLIEGFELALEASIFRLLVSRGPGAVVTLSDAALAVGGDGWRALLDLTHAVARRMAEAGVIEFVQGSELVNHARIGRNAAVRLKPGRAARLVGPSRLN
jgi:hypothetical protein